MTFNALVHDDINGGHDEDAEPAPSPFLIEPDTLSCSPRGEGARKRWRNAVFAVARKMLVEDGYRHFTVRRLSVQTKSSAQNIYNNIGTKDDIIIKSFMNYNNVLLDRFGDRSCNPYVKSIIARHKEVSDYPEYARAVHDTLFSNINIYTAIQSQTIKSIAPFVRAELFRYNAQSVNYMRLSKLLAAIARQSAREWLDGKCSAQEMLENSLADGELCLLGALSGRKGRWAQSIGSE
ncbi:hypothetical protein [Sphingobium mellinum]|uniref:hypothetical protein n=1 Tax=Sphingobium mellinum TaxID=1387166 RepID=UPI0030EE56D3